MEDNDKPSDAPNSNEPIVYSGPFKKGYDPRRNTGSNPRRTDDGRSVTQLARRYTEEALDIQLTIMRDPDTPAREKLKAAEYIINRGWGAPSQSIDLKASVEHAHLVATIDPTMLSAEQCLALIAARSLPASDADYREISRETDDQ